jgi:uncharacterized membrane protein YkvA (DUF1232 family)
MVVLWRLLRDREAHWALKLVAFCTLAYVISPVDALPEAVAPMIGWIDDVGLLLAVRLLLERPLAQYRYPLFTKAPPKQNDDAPNARAVEAELV